MKQRYDVGQQHLQPEASKRRARESSRGALRYITQVELTYTCTDCKTRASVRVHWSEHHTIPRGWRARDVFGSYDSLPKRTNHIFACSSKCRAVLDRKFPPRPTPTWFSAA